MTTSGPPRRDRPVVGSRNATGRPRRVAGRRPGEAPEETGQPELVGSTGVPVDEAPPAPPAPTAAQPAPPAPPVDDDEATEPGPAPGPAPTPTDDEVAPRRRGAASLVALVVAVVVLVGVIAAEAWYLWADDETTVSSQRPVVTGEIAHRAAVEAAAQAADDIVSTSWRNYDEQVDQAAGTMTEEFASKYRRTAQDVKAQVVASRKEVQVEVAATGVVRASEEQVEALIFLNQYVTTDGKDTAFTPYRALVTVVHTDSGWLVSDIQTR